MRNSLLTLATALLMVACAAPAPTVSAPYTVVITAANQLNPDRNGQPTPVEVRVYRLKGITAFNNSDFFGLYDNDAQLLASELVSKEAFMWQPGEAKVLTGKASNEERALGVFVGYRELNKAVWRGVAPLPAPKEVGRFSVFNPTFESSYIKVDVGPNKLAVSSNVVQVPVPTGSAPSLPSAPGGIRLPF